MAEVASESGEFRRGWPVLLVSVLAVGCGPATMPLFGLSVFAASLQAEFGWTRSQIGLASSFIAAGLVLSLPVAGKLADRFTSRNVASVSLLLMNVLLASLCMLHGSVMYLYLAYFAMAVLGGGATMVCYSRVVAFWFRKNRGLALGIMMTGVGIAGALAPIIVELAVNAVGWRGAWLILAGWGFVNVPLVWLFLVEPRKAGSAELAVGAVSGLNLGAAMRSHQFWLIAAGGLCFAVAIGGLLAHLVPILLDSGLARGQAVKAAALVGIGTIAGRLSCGFLVDRFPPPTVGVILLLMGGAGFLLLAFFPVATSLGIFLIGLCIGTEGDLQAVFTARYFGLRAMAEIFGWLYSISSVGLMLGPMVIGVLLSYSGHYRQGMLVSSGLMFAAAVFQGMLRSPIRLRQQWGAAAPGLPNSAAA